MGVITFLCFISPLVLTLISGATAAADERRLHRALFKDYDHTVRPVKNLNDTVVVKLGVSAVAILDVDVEANTMKMKTWTQMGWTDDGLQWDPKEYGGISHVWIPNRYVWRPDIVLYNSAEPDTMTPGFSDTNVVIYHDGQVLYIPPTFPKVTCVMENSVSEKECAFKYGSWTYDGYKIDLDFYDGRENMDLSSLTYNNKWAVTGTSAKKNVKKYPCCEEPYPDLTFIIKFERRK